MFKRKVIWYSTELANCPHYYTILASEYEIITAQTVNEFLKNLQHKEADAAILCFCFPSVEDINKLLYSGAKAGPVPVIACSKFFNCEFVRRAALGGIERFLVCGNEIENINEILSETIRGFGLRCYIKSQWPGCLNCSPHINHLIDEIIHAFPQPKSTEEYAKSIGIDRCWLHKICKQAFGLPFTSFLRNIRVHEAICMMQHTDLPNVDIAFYLKYSEESSMARDFRKELGFCPGEARKRLNGKSPEGLLH